MSRSINMIQASMIVLCSVGLLNHVIIIPILLDVADRDAWVSAAVAFFPFILWIFLLQWIVKRSAQQPLFEWIQSIAGKGISNIHKLIFGILLLLIAAITIKDTVTWAVASYLPETPTFALALLLVSLCYFAARSGIICIAIMSGILLPLIVLLGYFVMTANFVNKDYTRLFPILELGMGPLLEGIIHVGAGFAELMLLLLIQQHIGTRIKWWHLALLAVLITGLTLGPTTGSIAEFGPVESAKHRYPAFEQWKLVIVQRFIERVDFFSIYQWFAGAFVRVSVAMYLLTELSPFKGKKSKPVFLIALSVLLVLIMLLPISDIQFYDWLKYSYLPSTLICYLVLTLSLLIVAFFSKKGGSLRDKMG
ncbi:GerAB/ArcD/ProY family transporter [Paenibacillus radicis (ex Xue et al. 2023)]|uniref:Endospore germination permease n=1 Tax=Paenibacillus radicis (ex Xue et al. 2023) TaxID=2972489 RepID=A0ABT1Y8V9_9BACL|nr:endospore germination permease [Paenibacillus radicis (ex Xue et al. 2023)]MCR8629635.1 endospore germination permease [Paenibacillus radicis (ex Xue et al. 2023)]